ncbi:hypothetical protein E4T50_14990 [Aureobasidium sp. EXF-12298]|nr:hypothetical protein E4T50_14990 [Aureobasidium sp. EXF-12298]
MGFTITAALFRLLIAVPIFLIGLWTLNTLEPPAASINTLSTILSNQTLSLSSPGHDNTIATAYIPTSLYDHGRGSIFWCGLLALACGGGYIIDKAKDHIWTQLYALDEGAKSVPKGQKLRFHFQGVKNLNLTGWINATGARDTFMAWGASVLAVAGILYASIAAGIQNIASDTVTKQLENFLNSDTATEDTVFGSSSTHGSYTLESWTFLDQACRDGHKSRYLLLVILPFTISMLLSIAKPQWLTFTFGAKERPAWMTVPLEDNDSDEEDDDPMAGFGGNARDQWQLDSD